MSIEELNAKLADLEARRSELHAALSDRKAKVRADLIDAIKTQIAEYGFDPADIASAIMPRATKAKPSADIRQFQVWRLKADPAKTYTRGPLPGWLKDAAAAAGIDPTDKDGREKFKDEHMERAA